MPFFLVANFFVKCSLLVVLKAGTQRLEVLRSEYKEDAHTFEISFRQHTPPTPGQETKLPQVIPIKIGLIGKDSHRDLLQPSMVIESLSEYDYIYVLIAATNAQDVHLHFSCS